MNRLYYQYSDKMQKRQHHLKVGKFQKEFPIWPHPQKNEPDQKLKLQHKWKHSE